MKKTTISAELTSIIGTLIGLQQRGTCYGTGVGNEIGQCVARLTNLHGELPIDTATLYIASIKE